MAEDSRGELRSQHSKRVLRNAFWRGIAGEFLNPHFAITIIIVVLWAVAIYPPISVLAGCLRASSERIGDFASAGADGGISIEDATKRFEGVSGASGIMIAHAKEAVASISAVFTTVLGLVLGHYFGQRAEMARAQRAEIAVDSVRANLQEKGGGVVVDVRELQQDADSASKTFQRVLEELAGALEPEQLINLPADIRDSLWEFGVDVESHTLL